MLARRLLFVRPPRRARLSPLYAAIALLVALSLAGFLLARWPQPPGPASSLPAAGGGGQAGGTLEEGSQSMPARAEPRRGRWI